MRVRPLHCRTVRLLKFKNNKKFILPFLVLVWEEWHDEELVDAEVIPYADDDLEDTGTVDFDFENAMVVAAVYAVVLVHAEEYLDVNSV